MTLPDSSSGGSKNAKAYAALGIRLTDTSRTHLPKTNSSTLTLRSIPDPSNVRSRDSILFEEMQAGSISQDYHDVLVNGHRKTEASNNKHTNVAPDRASRRSNYTFFGEKFDAMPQPLVWKKDTGTLTKDSTLQQTRDALPSKLKPSVIQKRNNIISSLQEFLHGGRMTTEELRGRSASDSKVPQAIGLLKTQKDTHTRPELSTPSLLTYTRGLRSHMKKLRVLNTSNTSQPASFRYSESSHSTLSVITERLIPPRSSSGSVRATGEMQALNTTSSTNNKHISPAAMDNDDVDSPTLPSHLPNPSGHVSSLQLNSEGAEKSHSAKNTVSPGRNPQGASASPTSPVANEVRHSSTPAESTHEDDYIHTVMDKARHVRDAWKRHKREVKQDELKQSIRMIDVTQLGLL